MEIQMSVIAKQLMQISIELLELKLKRALQS